MEKMGRAGLGDPPFLVQNEWPSSPFDHESILMNVHFLGTATI